MEMENKGFIKIKLMRLTVIIFLYRSDFKNY